MINRRIIASGLSIVSALAVMGGATFAFFSSSATSNANTFGTGDLVLKINGAAGIATGPFAVTGAAPGTSSTQKLKLSNTGSVAASSVKVNLITMGGANPTLGDVLTLEFFNDANDDGIQDGGETVLGTAHLTDGVWTNYTLPGVTVAGSGGTYNLGATVTFDSGADNSYQGNNATFSIEFVATQ